MLIGWKLTLGFWRFETFVFWSLEDWIFEISILKCLKIRNVGNNMLVFYFTLKSSAGMLFSTRGDEVSMCNFKKVDFRWKNMIFNLGGTEPPFRANFIFGYAQSGSERTSFSGSTVQARQVPIFRPRPQGFEQLSLIQPTSHSHSLLPAGNIRTIAQAQNHKYTIFLLLESLPNKQTSSPMRSERRISWPR